MIWDTLRGLADLGVPSAIIALVAIAIFLKTHSLISKLAASSAVLLAIALGAAQLGPSILEFFRPIRIETEPELWHGLTPAGRPTDVLVKAIRGEELIKDEVEYASFDRKNFARRKLRLSAFPGDHSQYAAHYNDTVIGRVQSSELRHVGWMPKYDAGANNTIWSTKRVYVGDVILLGRSALGNLELRILRYAADGTAHVALRLNERAARPEIVKIKNKSFEIQTFLGIHEHLIIVLEADFTVEEPWAKFAVIGPQQKSMRDAAAKNSARSSDRELLKRARAAAQPTKLVAPMRHVPQ